MWNNVSVTRFYWRLSIRVVVVIAESILNLKHYEFLFIFKLKAQTFPEEELHDVHDFLFCHVLHEMHEDC